MAEIVPQKEKCVEETVPVISSPLDLEHVMMMLTIASYREKLPQSVMEHITVLFMFQPLHLLKTVMDLREKSKSTILVVSIFGRG